MRLTPLSPEGVPPAVGGYVNGLRVDHATRLVFISGQVPETPAGEIPDGIEGQCRLVWAHIERVLAEAGMDVRNLVKVTTYLSDRAHAGVNTTVRNDVLGTHHPSLTVVVTGIWDPAWLIEIEAIAAA